MTPLVCALVVLLLRVLLLVHLVAALVWQLFFPTHTLGPALVVRIARPTSLAVWHRGHSHREPNRRQSES